MKALAHHIPGLEDINLNNCRKLTDQAVVALTNQCLNLHTLELEYCKNLTAISVCGSRAWRPVYHVLRRALFTSPLDRMRLEVYRCLHPLVSPRTTAKVVKPAVCENSRAEVLAS